MNDAGVNKDGPEVEQAGVSRRRALGLAGLGTALLAGGVASPAEANIDPGSPQDATLAALGSIGVSSGQVARLSVVLYMGGIPGGGCVVAMEIRRITGDLLERQVFQLSTGQGAFLDASGTQGRDQIYGVVRHLDPTGRGDPDHVVGATLEVFDTQTGRTTALLAPLVEAVNDPSLLVGQ